MPIGVIVNVIAVILGGITGTMIGPKLKESFKENLNLVFGEHAGSHFCSDRGHGDRTGNPSGGSDPGRSADAPEGARAVVPGKFLRIVRKGI